MLSRPGAPARMPGVEFFDEELKKILSTPGLAPKELKYGRRILEQRRGGVPLLTLDEARREAIEDALVFFGDVQRAATYLGCSKSMVYRLVKGGVIPVDRIPSVKLRFRNKWKTSSDFEPQEAIVQNVGGLGGSGCKGES